MKHECYNCHIKTVEKLIKKFKPVNGVGEKFMYEARNILERNPNTSNPVLSRTIHAMAREKLNHSDLYEEEKKMANELLLGEYGYWKKVADKSKNPFHTAARLSVIGNIIDYGAHSVKEDISVQLKHYFQKPLHVDHSPRLQEEILKARSILFLGDNAGEIVFDKLFIETFRHPNITYAVRGAHIINDVTIEDAKQVGMEKLCRIITNGYDAPSTLLEFCSSEFIKEFNNADLVIAKGQGNFEGLMNTEHKNLFFMFIAKCDPIAELMGVSKDDMVIKARSSKPEAGSWKGEAGSWKPEAGRGKLEAGRGKGSKG